MTRRTYGGSVVDVAGAVDLHCLLDVDASKEPSAADLAWARSLAEDPCTVLSPALSPSVPAPVTLPAGDPG